MDAWRNKIGPEYDEWVEDRCPTDRTFFFKLLDSSVYRAFMGRVLSAWWARILIMSQPVPAVDLQKWAKDNEKRRARGEVELPKPPPKRSHALDKLWATGAYNGRVSSKWAFTTLYRTTLRMSSSHFSWIVEEQAV